MFEELLQEYKHIFKEPFPLMLCRGCDDDEIIEINLEQCIIAHCSIVVTLLGIVIEVRNIQSSKAHLPILATV